MFDNITVIGSPLVLSTPAEVDGSDRMAVQLRYAD
jgi:hypothetical protein